MNRRLLGILGLLAFAIGVVAVVLHLRRGAVVGPGYVVDADDVPPVVVADAPLSRKEYDDAAVGGVFAGTVVEADGDAPIPYARVLLVAIADETTVVGTSLDAAGGGQIIDIPVYGTYKAVAQDTTDAKGQFRLAAGSARVVAIFATEPGHGPAVKAHLRTKPLKPGADHVLRLARAGVFEGTVVDRVTKQPVAGADVAIFLQHPANQDERGVIEFTPELSWGRFQSFVSKVLGPLVWGIEPRGEDGALHLVTDVAGRFSLRPLTSATQLEIVITHPSYAWTDSDPEVALAKDNPEDDPPKKVLTRKRRTVVPPGETVARTFELERGKSISGTVVDDQGLAFDRVEIYLEHVAQYAQHHFYRSRQRVARTDEKGRFTLAGLSFGDYVIRMVHPAFETKWFYQVKEGSDERYVVPRGGWIEGTVDGGKAEIRDFVADIRLAHVGGGDQVVRKERIVVRDRKFELTKVEPGRYDVALTSGPLVTAPQRVEVRAGVPAVAAFELRAGGGFRATVTSSAGTPVDPASAEIELVPAEGPPRRAGLVVGRRGLFETEGLTAGRYRIVVRAPGFLEAASEPFDVAAESFTPVATLVLRRPGWLRITSVRDAAGRTPGEGVIREFAVVRSDGTPVPASRLSAGTPVQVPPGPTTVRVTTTSGGVFETTPDIAEGATVAVDVVLPSEPR